MRPITVRLPDEVAELLEAIARVENTTVSKIVREGVQQTLRRRTIDKKLLESDRQLFTKLKQQARQDVRVLRNAVGNGLVGVNGRRRK